MTENMISSLGDFSHEKNILKKFSRRGQCFSTSKFICELEASEILPVIEDLKKGEYNFTDGCGHVSVELAQEIS